MGALTWPVRRSVLHDGASSHASWRKDPATPGGSWTGVPNDTHYLVPGDVHVAARPCVITTIVGSCVAVCLADRASGIGGMNHYVLPDHVARDSSARCGLPAMRKLIDSLLGCGARMDRLEAKVFGGASILGTSALAAGRLGARNVQLAYDVLRQEGIPVVASDIEGQRGRKIIYHTHDGAAWVRRL
jgi:chemotaxis protein CheD